MPVMELNAFLSTAFASSASALGIDAAERDLVLACCAETESEPGLVSACVVELPQRMNGGGAPKWDELEMIAQYCRRKNVKLHCDGARLWEICSSYSESCGNSISL